MRALWCLLALSACDGNTSAVSHARAASSAAASARISPTTDALKADAEAKAKLGATRPAKVRPDSPCNAPSLTVRSALDARDEASLERCGDPSVGPKHLGARCGEQPEVAPLALDRLDEAVRALDPAVAANIRAIAERGGEKGRRHDVFGLVGDSMTVSGGFLRELADARRVTLDPDVASRLRVGGQSVLELFRGVKVSQVRGVWRDSFRAPRAAKVGARADWALAGGEHSPLARMVRDLSPAVAFVLYGGNDAAFVPTSLAELETKLRRHLGEIIDRLEAEGVVPVLHTLARHGDAPGHPTCGPPGTLSDWRIAVQTNALSAVVADIACERRLPLIDLHWALDAGDVHGLSPDAVHPSHYVGGSGVLDARGLRCGYNIRNYLTLRMLKDLHPLLAP